jgi:hypothetical protein
MALGNPTEQPRDPDALAFAGASGSRAARSGLPSSETDPLDQEGKVNPTTLMALARAAVNHAEDSGGLSKARQAMVRSYRSYNNQHNEGSKYKHKNYSARSKMFVPKTRMAVKKAKVAAAVALFSTADVISIEPGNDSDDAQRISADVNRELIKYRLDSANHRAGVNWYPISMSAVEDANVAGICVSKQYWEYEEVVDEFENDDPNVIDMEGNPLPTVKKPRILRDRPAIDLIPPENVICDMSAPFYDVVQGGLCWIVKYGLPVGYIKTMMKKGHQRLGGGAWYELTDEVIQQAVNDHSGASVRSARGQGSDRMSKTNTPHFTDFDIVWVHENFVRHTDGRDYHFWSLGTRKLLSEPRETIESYPGHKGDRPYVMGVAEIEAHNVIPMSPVESWRSLQDEINDFRNLTLDTMKQSVSPTVIVTRGAQVDMRQVRERGPDSTILVNDLEKDIRFQENPGPNGQVFNVADRISVEFDDAAGGFSQSSVGSNRNLNETVGGMQLLSSSANSVAEFNLRTWVETWVEPVIRQLVWLEQHYESDETILAIAGEKAGVFQKHGQDVDILELLDRDVTVRINVGIGAADPNMRLDRFGRGIGLLGQMAESGMFGEQVTPKAEPIFDEVLGLTGYKSASRFFTFKTIEEIEQAAAEAPEQPDPAIELQKQQMEQQAAQEQQKMQLEADKMGMEKEKAQLEAEMKRGESELKKAELALRIQELKANMAAKDREIGLMEQEVGFKGQDLALRGQAQEKDYGLREKEFERAGSSGEREYQLKAAGQNKKIIDERTAAEVAPGPTPLEQMMQTMAQQTAAILASMQQQNQATAAQNAQLQDAMIQLMQRMNAPKRVVRDEADRVIGVE